jgi:hypothetical protein
MPRQRSAGLRTDRTVCTANSGNPAVSAGCPRDDPFQFAWNIGLGEIVHAQRRAIAVARTKSLTTKFLHDASRLRAIGEPLPDAVIKFGRGRWNIAGEIVDQRRLYATS